MLVMPLLHKSKIYNVEIRLKNAFEVIEHGVIQRQYESDVVVNGRSYNQSSYYVPNAPINNIVNFIRDNSLYVTNSFILTSRRNEQGKMNAFRIMNPLSHVTDGLDMLYGSVLLNMKKDIPGKRKDRNISLKKLGVTAHVTEENLKKIENRVRTDTDVSLMKDECYQKLFDALHFLEQFECSIIDGATIDERTILGLMVPLSGINTDSARDVRSYYRLAKENGDEYMKLQYLSHLLTGESLHWIKEEKDLIKVKNRDVLAS